MREGHHRIGFYSTADDITPRISPISVVEKRRQIVISILHFPSVLPTHDSSPKFHAYHVGQESGFYNS